MDYRTWLQREFSERRDRNPAYSLRAFAKQLRLSPSALSEILSGQRRVTLGTAAKIADNCQMSPEERQIFLQPFLPASPIAERFQCLDAETFAEIAGWQHYAILGLAHVRNNRADPAWIASKLGISSEEAQVAYGDLIRLKLVKDVSGHLVQTSMPLTTSKDRTDSHIQKHVRQVFTKSLDSLENVSVEKRDFSVLTMSVNPERLPEAKHLIEKFRRSLCDFLDKGEQSEVYSLAIALFPLTSESSGSLHQ